MQTVYQVAHYRLPEFERRSQADWTPELDFFDSFGDAMRECRRLANAGAVGVALHDMVNDCVLATIDWETIEKESAGHFTVR